MNWYEAMEEAQAHGITRAAMAGELGLNPNTLALWEREEREVDPTEKQAYDKALQKLGDE